MYNPKTVCKLYQGKQVEQYIADRLTAKGIQLIARNFRCRSGEIDLICLHHDELVFIEVRSKTREDYGTALESVSTQKQQKLIKTAQFFLKRYSEFSDIPCRFDVIAVTQHSIQPHIEWIKNAFY